LHEFEIDIKDPAKARTQYKRCDFSGDPTEKAYIIGFSVGDLNAYMPNEATSQTVVARCHTTHSEQIKLFRELFAEYGHVQASRHESGSTHLNCYLNTTFKFLLDEYSKNIQEWVRSGDEKLKAAFMAGYTDAEGSFGINQGKARFKIDAYDYSILQDMENWLTDIGIRVILRRIGKKGDKRGGGKEWNDDLWRLQINQATSIKEFIDSVSLFLKHDKRVRDANRMIENITTRIENGTVG
jgi:intein-encoded DNA endonuclease-like protein